MLALTGLAASMVVNALVTGLLVFKILKVFLGVKPTSVERTLGLSSSPSGGPKLQHIIFIIIESGMALFAIQVVRVVISSLIEAVSARDIPSLTMALNIVIPIHQALSVIIISFNSYFFCLTDDVYLPRALHQQ